MEDVMNTQPLEFVSGELENCIRRTIAACHDAIDDSSNGIKATKARIWLKNLAGWLPPQED